MNSAVLFLSFFPLPWLFFFVLAGKKMSDMASPPWLTCFFSSCKNTALLCSTFFFLHFPFLAVLRRVC